MVNGMKIVTAFLSECGGKKQNDDTVSIMQQEDRTGIFVGDGLGGYAGGKMASKAAADVFLKKVESGNILMEEDLFQAVETADEVIKEMQKASRGRMKTTVVFLAIEGKRARWIHVGDSRLYHFKNGHLLEQTMDHSVSQMAVLMGEITQKEIRFHEDRNRVLRALGSENARPDISGICSLEEGEDVFLLCTDGFWEYVYEKEMEELLSDIKEPEPWLEAMKSIVQSRATGEHDNFSAAAVFVKKE